eukprot:TRINITY_DN9825_c0_g1_i2.p1 TRINITY_DN9825_c0_g1~~TRINITY_DN9825_c0_g1_i2.p1  ORF type:complete len:136 (+),score=10.17 TRINITY_DN9825_c0_g1_i2:126-533(+)
MSDLHGIIPKCFITSSILASVVCFSRPDYNLALNIFAYLSWTGLRDQKARIIYLYLWTLILDVVFLLIWWKLFNWESVYEEPLEDWLQLVVLTLFIVNIFLKLVIIFLMFLMENEIKKALSWAGFRANVRSIFAY